MARLYERWGGVVQHRASVSDSRAPEWMRVGFSNGERPWTWPAAWLPEDVRPLLEIAPLRDDTIERLRAPGYMDQRQR